MQIELTVPGVAIVVAVEGLLVALPAIMSDVDLKVLKLEGESVGPFAPPYLVSFGFAQGLLSTLILIGVWKGSLLCLLVAGLAGPLALVAATGGEFSLLGVGLTADEDLGVLARVFSAGVAAEMLYFAYQAAARPAHNYELSLYMCALAGAAALLATAGAFQMAPFRLGEGEVKGARAFIPIPFVVLFLLIAAFSKHESTNNQQGSEQQKFDQAGLPSAKGTEGKQTLQRCKCGEAIQAGVCVPAVPAQARPRPSLCKSPWYFAYDPVVDAKQYLGEDEHFRLHLAGMLLPGYPSDACKDRSLSRGGQLCLSTSIGRQCISQSDACAESPACSSATVEITGRDFVNGIRAEFFDGEAKTNATLAYTGRLFRVALCQSGKMISEHGQGFTYYLEPM